MSQSYKICPICRTPAHRNAVLCTTCGASLGDVAPVGDAPPRAEGVPRYDPRHGEADLYEGELSRRADALFVGALLTVAALACVGAVLFLAPRLFSRLVPAGTVRQAQATSTPVPTRAGAGFSPVATNTPRRPTLAFATVTPAPPTPTITPTLGPCTRQVSAGDTLLSLAYACGHRSMDIIPLILELNELDAPEAIMIGEEIVIPWPTATLDPNVVPSPADALPDADAADPNVTLAPADRALRGSAAMQATQTLQPGVTWHRVSSGESAASIAYLYGATVEVLSQLNPEMTFSQCDFGAPSGGPSCIVPVYVGQLVRVPAPTPTPTLPPTASGSETATPSPTATFNAPSLTSPGNLSLFRRDELVTLRWVASGTLGPGQTYRVRVEDSTSGAVYTANTDELFFIMPHGWQSGDGRRHEFAWRVSVIDEGRPDDPIFTTETRTFSWEGTPTG